MLWIEVPVGAQTWLRSEMEDVCSCRGFSKTVLVFWEEPAAVLPQEDGAGLVQQVQRTLSLAELSLEQLPGRLLNGS